MKIIPFVANHVDDMHCVHAVFRMVHQYFLKTDLSWEDIEAMMHTMPGKGTWTIPGEIAFVQKGIKILNIEPVDYQRLYDEGIDYLNEAMGPQSVNYYLKKSNLESVIPFIPEYLQQVKHETRKASIDEIKHYLSKEKLVGAGINSNILNQNPGFNIHFVLIYEATEKNELILHDPGLPPLPARKVTVQEFEACFNFEGSNGGITVFG